MTFPNVPSPLGGILGANTASFYKLDPTGKVPLEPILDLVPGITPLRVTLDMVDNETITFNYDVTEHAVQSFLDTTSNVRKRLETMTITGTLGATPPLLTFPLSGVAGPALNPPVPPVPGSLLRLDLLRLKNLQNIADDRRPVMVVTPRYGMNSAFITSISEQWNPSMGESMIVSVNVKEARLVSPITGLVEPDFPAQTAGNNAATGGGQTSTADTGFEASSPPVDSSGPTQLAPTTGGVP